MAVVFEATIKMDDTDNWYIELKDTVDGRVESCLSIEELEKKVEEFGLDYGGHVDEVKWLKDDDILPPVMDDVRVKMAEQRVKIEDLTGETIEELSKKK
ncbi:MAG: hypothetical protein QM497_04015 [Sulfurimonas sp.]